jgi:hypothetical protein
VYKIALVVEEGQTIKEKANADEWNENFVDGWRPKSVS